MAHRVDQFLPVLNCGLMYHFGTQHTRLGTADVTCPFWERGAGGGGERDGDAHDKKTKGGRKEGGEGDRERERTNFALNANEHQIAISRCCS